MKTKATLGLLSILVMMSCSTPAIKHHYYTCQSPEDINSFLSEQKNILVSGHRGGNLEGYPENCIETFDKILEYMPTLYEVDPHMTKDSMIVLMHDDTIDRTTTGSGRVKDYTYSELQEFFLKDKWDNVTGYKIPLVKEAVEWSIDKVILNFDIKDVSRDVLIPLVNSTGAVNCMYTVRDTCEALEVYRLDPTARMSIWVKNMEALRAYEATGIPWDNFPMAYVQSNIMRSENAELYQALRSRGVKCMVSTSPKEDRKKTVEERAEGFRNVIESSPDVIESDFPTEVQCLL